MFIAANMNLGPNKWKQYVCYNWEFVITKFHCIKLFKIVLLFILFQAALDTKHKMGPAAEKLTVIHFNDVYNVEPRDKEPEGGAAR